MIKNISKKTFGLIVSLILILQLFLPSIVSAGTVPIEDGDDILLGGTAIYNSASNQFEYDGGKVLVKVNNNFVTERFFNVSPGDNVVIELIPDQNYSCKLLGKDNQQNDYNITLNNNKYEFSINSSASKTIDFTPVFSNLSNHDPSPQPQQQPIPIPENSIQLQVYDNLGNALNYEIIKNDIEFFKAQAVIKYSYDKTAWFELSNFNDDDDLVEASNEFQQSTYAFVNHDKVYIKVESMENGKFVSLLEEEYNNKNERVNGDIALNKVYELTTKNRAYKLEYDNGVYSVNWIYNDPDAPEDMNVKNGTAKIIKVGDTDVSKSGGNSIEGGFFRIKQGEKVTVELKPNYGYQLSEAGFNGFALVGGKNVNQFTFTMGGTNLHFAAMFVKTDDIINATGKNISGASVSGANKIVSSGNIKLDISDLEVTDKMKAEFEKKAGDSKILSYLDLELSNIVYKTANGTQVWENQLSELNEEITVTLKLKNQLSDKSGTYYIIREHNGVYDNLGVEYDKDENTLTFKTNKFSEYAIAFKENVVTTTKAVEENATVETVKLNNPKTFDEIIKYTLVGLISVICVSTIIVLKKRMN